MKMADRLRRLENEVVYLAAIVDGCEAQTREATVAVLGLLAHFLVGKGAFDHDELAAFLAGCADPDTATEDHVGRLIHDMRRNIEFHRDLESDTLPSHVSAVETLGTDEIAQIRARSEEQVAFEREPVAKNSSRKRRKRVAIGSLVQ